MMIIKKRARKPLASGAIRNVWFYSHGVGGVDGKPVLSITVGDVNVFFTKAEKEHIDEQIRQHRSSIIPALKS